MKRRLNITVELVAVVTEAKGTKTHGKEIKLRKLKGREKWRQEDDGKRSEGN